MCDLWVSMYTRHLNHNKFALMTGGGGAHYLMQQETLGFRSPPVPRVITIVKLADWLPVYRREFFMLEFPATTS